MNFSRKTNILHEISKECRLFGCNLNGTLSLEYLFHEYFGLYALENLKQSSIRDISRALDDNVVAMCEKDKVRAFRTPLGGDLLIWMMRKGKVFICHLVVFTFRLVNPSVIY